MKNRCILGLTTSGHGFSGALSIDGKIVAANSLERLSRKKYDILLPISKTDLKTFGWKSNPNTYIKSIDLPFDLENDYSSVDFNKLDNFHLLIEHVLDAGGVELKDVECVAYSYRHVESVKRFFKEKNPNIEFIVPEHHFSHACQAYLPSPFDESAIMVLDGQGVPMKRTDYDQLSGCLAYGRKNSIEILTEFPVSCSLGNLYAEITRLCGFMTNEEGKTMGLSPYGGPEFYEKIKNEIRYNTKEYAFRNFKRLMKRGFRPEEYIYSLGSYQKYLRKFKPREKNGAFTDTYNNLAYLGQKCVEDVMIYLAEWLYKKTGSRNLCISGGVGLNCVANYKMFKNSSFENIFVYPNAGDNGLAVGQALYVHNLLDNNPREYITTHDYLGKPYRSEEIQKALDICRNNSRIKIEEFQNMGLLYNEMARAIEAGKITGWYQGRSEFGPRALGNRSILADPRRKDMKDILNSRVKFRESYRPFTPSVLKERANEYFALDIESPFMLLASDVLPNKANIIPAITHVDNTARVQTVSREVNERYYDLIKAFEKLTDVPMVLNTSFNIAGKPIVETPEDAIRCFLSTGIDVLGIDRFLLSKIQN
jgi:carbamoyltransferase